MFNDKTNPIISNGVAVIGGKYLIPKRIDTVRCYCTDDDGKMQKNRLNNVLYFTDSPVNILSAIELTKSMKYDEVTWVRTKIKILPLIGILLSTKIQ